MVFLKKVIYEKGKRKHAAYRYCVQASRGDGGLAESPELTKFPAVAKLVKKIIIDGG